MKYIICVIVLLFPAVTVWSQEGEKKEKKVHHEIGLNASYFVKQFVDLGDNDLSISPYLLTYRMYFGTWALRFGIGATYNKNNTERTRFTDKEAFENYSIDMRIGMEKRLDFSTRWKGFIGIDGIGFGNKDRQELDSGFDIVTVSETESGWGIGPVLGVQFFINEKLSLSTEASYYAAFSTREKGTFFTSFPGIRR